MSDCNVCVNKYNKASRKKVVCPYCTYDCCRECISKFLLDTSQNPFCMSCKVGWNLEFLDTSMPPSFIKKLREHQATIVFEREKSLLPDTMNVVIRKKECEKFKEQAKQLELKIRKLQIQKNELLYQARMVFLHPDSKKEEKEEKRKFVKQCPVADCRGFLSTQWKCELCETYTCSKCHAIKGKDRDGDHTCKDDDLKSVELLKSDSKNCPKCGVSIFKIEGCSQMWCCVCHTAFNWNTLRIETGVIHNPHYYQWLREQNNGRAPRNIGDVPCGGIPYIVDIRKKLYDFKMDSKQIDLLASIHRVTTHIENITIPQYRPLFNLQDNEDLRIRFLENDLTEKRFKSLLKMRETKRQRELAIRQVLEMFVLSSTDVFQRIINEDPKAFNKDEIIPAFNYLRTYMNDELDKVSKRFNKCRFPIISKNWETNRA